MERREKDRIVKTYRSHSCFGRLDQGPVSFVPGMDGEEDSGYSSGPDDDQPRRAMKADSDNYEDVSESETADTKLSAARLNEVGVVDVSYAQRTVWLVKVCKRVRCRTFNRVHVGRCPTFWPTGLPRSTRTMPK